MVSGSQLQVAPSGSQWHPAAHNGAQRWPAVLSGGQRWPAATLVKTRVKTRVTTQVTTRVKTWVEHLGAPNVLFKKRARNVLETGFPIQTGI